MAYLGMNFDANVIEPNTFYEPVPTGWYKASVLNSEMKQTKDGGGSYLELELVILEGQYENRRLWDRLNLHNRNQQAVEIAYKTLSAICHAIGVMTVTDSEQLHGKPMLVRAVLVPANDRYDAKNDIKGYKPVVATGTSVAPSIPSLPPVPDYVPNSAIDAQPPAKRSSSRPPATTVKPWQKGSPPASFAPTAVAEDNEIPF